VPVALFPRGWPAVFSLWYLILIALEASHFRLWLSRLIVAALIALAALVTTFLLSRGAVQALRVDTQGIMLGAELDARDVLLAWSDVQALRIGALPRGAILEVLLAPGAATPSARSGARQFGDLALFLIPFIGLLRCRPALLVPWPGPPRYRVPLVGVTPADLHSQLTAVVPGIQVESVLTN
jgi:hypothetical protein